MVENPPANAGDTGSSPGLGRPHMPWSNWAREPQLLSLRVYCLVIDLRKDVLYTAKNKKLLLDILKILDVITTNHYIHLSFGRRLRKQ